jgi:hypothetical protein
MARSPAEGRRWLDQATAGVLPPGAAKSTYTSVVFPSYILGRNPGSNVLVVSYGSDLPRKFGRRCRSIVQQPAYRRIFDTGLLNDVAAADQ